MRIVDRGKLAGNIIRCARKEMSLQVKFADIKPHLVFNRKKSIIFRFIPYLVFYIWMSNTARGRFSAPDASIVHLPFVARSSTGCRVHPVHNTGTIKPVAVFKY